MGRHHERGQSAMELAVVMPVLMLIVLGCLDLGRAFSLRMALTNGVREGARIGSLYPAGYTDPETGLTIDANQLILERTKEDIRAQGIDDSKVSIQVFFGDPVNPAPYPERGDPIIVTASYPLQLFSAYLFGAEPVVIKATNQMAIVGEP